MNPTKPWYQSKTLWFNALCAVLYVIEANVALAQPLLPVNVYAVFVPVLLVGNAVLRVISAARLTQGAA